MEQALTQVAKPVALLDMLMHYIEDHQENWDELVSVLALANNSRPHQTMGVALMDWVTPRRLRNFSRERVVPQSGRPHSGGLPDRAPGSLVKDPGSKRQDAHTQLVWAAKTSRKHDTTL